MKKKKRPQIMSETVTSNGKHEVNKVVRVSVRPCKPQATHSLRYFVTDARTHTRTHSTSPWSESGR